MSTDASPPKHIMRRGIGVAGALVLMTAFGCSENTSPAPLTLESVAGRYVLESVGGKSLPAPGPIICFLQGCSEPGLVTAGSFEIGNPTPGTWTSQVTTRSQVPVVEYTNIRTGQATIHANRSLVLEEEAGPGFTGPWEGSLKGDILVINFLAAHSFRKVY